MKSLGSALGTFDALQKVEILFYGCENITDEGIKGFCDGMKNLSSLLLFKMKLSPSDFFSRFVSVVGITNNGVKFICKLLQNFSSSLQFLDLGFSEYKKIDDSAVKEMGSTLKKLSYLKRTTVRFEDCQKISQNTQDSLLKMIKTQTKEG